ncbi:hypothetical protein [Geodermatophilus sp. DSM 44513]|uniref:hypothetical protein n=1 Tax=Geodermatophilus sp. DSM 44513 TaxID=1528104 RepID=UPI00127A3CD7|nr:hypothetical protein [Geodermatophilus sp. DSM 44513]WNV77653.1 hypothetical protein RTG05_10365 [Geodermatophilus sp. DSM 44513]
MSAYRHRPLARSTLAAALALVGAGLSGCSVTEEEAEEPTSPVEVPDLRGEDDLQDPYTGVLDADVAEDLDAYTGIEVTLLAEVAETISPGAFTVTSPQGEEFDPVLVVAAEDAEDTEPAAGDQLYMAATPVDGFDAEVVVDELGLDVAPEQLAAWADEVFLVATVLEPAP